MIGPHPVQSPHLDQLRGDPNPVSGPSNAAFENVTNSELSSDIRNINGLPLVGGRRASRDNDKIASLGQQRDGVFGHPVCEVFLLGIAAHIDERQHRDGRLVRAPRRLARSGKSGVFRCVGTSRLPNTEWLSNVLESFQSHILEGKFNFAANLSMSIVRYADATWLSNPFKTRRDIDAITKDIVLIDDDVAEVNSDAEFDSGILRYAAVPCGHVPLDFHCATRGVYDAGEFH
jgi:hypothetical protein